MTYLGPVRRLRSLARRYGFDLLIAVAAIEGALEVAFRGDSLRTRHTASLFAVPAAALVVLPLLAPPAALRGAGRGLAVGAGVVVRRRATHRVHVHRVRRWDRRGFPARPRTRRCRGANRVGHRPRRCRDRGLQQAGPSEQRIHLRPCGVRDRAGSLASRCGSDPLRWTRLSNGRSTPSASESRRHVSRSPKSGLASRGAARHRCPLRQRHGAPGRRRPSPSARGGGGGQGRADERSSRSDGPRSRRCAACSAPFTTTAPTSNWRRSPGSTISIPSSRGSASPAFSSRYTSRAVRRRSPGHRSLGVSHHSGGPDQHPQARRASHAEVTVSLRGERLGARGTR